MANIKISRQVDLPGIDYEDLSPIVVPNVPSGTVIRQGSVWMLDVTQPGISPASGNLIFTPSGPGNFFPAYTPTAEVVVPPWHPNIGTVPTVVGVYQGPTFTLVNPPLRTGIPVRQLGGGVVLASSEGGTVLNVGLNLIPSLTQIGAKQGSAALNQTIGIATGYLINTTLTTATTAGGAQTPGVASIVGMSATVSNLTIDTPASGVQETVATTATTAGVNANQTFTIANIGAGTTLGVTIGGVVSNTYLTTGSDTATTAALALVRAINATPGLVAGPGAIILPATNAAGVITVRALNAGSASNSITTVATAVGGAVTNTAGGATMVNGTNNTISITPANAHAIGAPVQGITNTNGALLIPATANHFQNYLVNAYIMIR
jgi:hypothetical protein